MFLLHKTIRNKSESESGFVLILALVAITVLIAIGFFALTIISDELMISYRLTGEIKALSAAESGVNASFANVPYDSFYQTAANTTNILYTIESTHVDSVNDPSTSYSGNVFWAGRSPCNTDSDSKHPYVHDIYRTTITGKDSQYGSSVSIEVGVAGSAYPAGDPNYPP
ncbi:MAG: hypothetical protein NTW65_05775 [Deltaproteobacteria bacterium]|nr:hypothetical protein [Deltaproteobacteria bacterium]